MERCDECKDDGNVMGYDNPGIWFGTFTSLRTRRRNHLPLEYNVIRTFHNVAGGKFKMIELGMQERRVFTVTRDVWASGRNVLAQTYGE